MKVQLMRDWFPFQGFIHEFFQEGECATDGVLPRSHSLRSRLPSPPLDVGPLHSPALEIKKVKFSHTRYRALGPELIPVYRQSARR